MKNETQKQIEKLQAELDKLKVLAERENKFEVGRWYKLKDYPKVICFAKEKGECSYNGFGISHYEKWADWVSFGDKLSNWTLATDTEVLEALTKEAEKRGFKKGVRFETAIYSREETIKGNFYLYAESDFSLMNSTGVVFDAETCQWATLIEDEKIYIGENEVEVEDGDCYIDGHWLSVNTIKALLPSNPTLFGKILKRIEW